MGLLLILILFVGVHLFFRTKTSNRPIVIAHRGAGKLAPENTMASIHAAIDHRVGYVEVDIQRSKDNVLCLLHDDSVDRTTNGKGLVRQLLWDEVCQLDAGSHFSAVCANERIPTLEQALAAVKEQDVKLALELKSPAHYPNLESEVHAAIQRHQMGQQVAIISFDYESLRQIHALAPEIPLAAISWYPGQTPQFAKIVDLFFVSVLLDPTLLYRMRRRGHSVWVWTVNNQLIMRLLMFLGVDGITTDRPDLFNKIQR